jgi:predicted RNase H-like HicB family nuclease
MKFRVRIEQDEDGKFVASCPTLPGCWSQGDTRDEAMANIADAMKGYLESLAKHGDAVPPPITEDVIDIDIGEVA